MILVVKFKNEFVGLLLENSFFITKIFGLTNILKMRYIIYSMKKVDQQKTILINIVNEEIIIIEDEFENGFYEIIANSFSNFIKKSIK